MWVHQVSVFLPKTVSSCGKQHVWFGKYVRSEMVLVHEMSIFIFKSKENNKLFYFSTSISEHHPLQKQKPAFPITTEV